MIPVPPKLLELLATRDPGLADLTLGLRELVLEEAPEATELVHDVKYAIALKLHFHRPNERCLRSYRDLHQTCEPWLLLWGGTARSQETP